MFEGTTTITFSKEAGMLMMSQNLSDMFKMPLEVTAMDMSYSGLEVKFGPPKEKDSPERVMPGENAPNENVQESSITEEAE